MERYRILESEVDFDLIGNKFRPDYTQLIYFYRNYGALNLPKGSMVALTQLSGTIKPSFCNTSAKA